MCISKRNASGYIDLTAHQALTKIETAERKTYMPVVYICSPYTGDIRLNVLRARKYSRFAVDESCIPIAPHLLFPQFVSEPSEREIAMKMNMGLLRRSDEVWVFGDSISPGMAREISEARRLRKFIRCFNTACEEVTWS